VLLIYTHFQKALPARFQPHLPYLITSIVQQSNATKDPVLRIIIKYQQGLEVVRNANSRKKRKVLLMIKRNYY
jgi:hypothetical protein